MQCTIGNKDCFSMLITVMSQVVWAYLQEGLESECLQYLYFVTDEVGC